MELDQNLWVYANVSATLKSIETIRDFASIAADSRDPEHIGFALQHLYAMLSTYIMEEPTLFLIEDFEYNKHALEGSEPLNSENPVEELHREATQLLGILSDRINGTWNNPHSARTNSSDLTR